MTGTDSDGTLTGTSSVPGWRSADRRSWRLEDCDVHQRSDGLTLGCNWYSLGVTISRTSRTDTNVDANELGPIHVVAPMLVLFGSLSLFSGALVLASQQISALNLRTPEVTGMALTLTFFGLAATACGAVIFHRQRKNPAPLTP